MQQEIALLAANFRRPPIATGCDSSCRACRTRTRGSIHAYWTSEQQTRAPRSRRSISSGLGAVLPEAFAFSEQHAAGVGQIVLCRSRSAARAARSTTGSSRTSSPSSFRRPSTRRRTRCSRSCTRPSRRWSRKRSPTTRRPPSSAPARRSATRATAPCAAARCSSQRVAPDLVPGYMRFYLQTLGQAASRRATPPRRSRQPSRSRRRFSPRSRKQIDVVLGGI